jgi:hypothetical protein
MRHPHCVRRAASRGPNTTPRFLKEAKTVRFHNILPALAFVAVIGGAFSTHAGPCTAQIAQVEQQISAASANSDIGPSSAQTVGAQLGRQPTPQTVQDAEMKANTLAQTMLEHVKKADAADDGAGCTEALSALKEQFGLE